MKVVAATPHSLPPDVHAFPFLLAAIATEIHNRVVVVVVVEAAAAAAAVVVVVVVS